MKKQKKKMPAVSTAALPDFVFMLLFFFMTVTTVRNSELLVENELPRISQLSSLDKKDRVIEVFVGKPSGELTKMFGTEPKIQLNNGLARVTDVAHYILSELSKKPEEVRNLVTISLKIDESVHVGVVEDIKKELQSINQLKISYSAQPSIRVDNTD